ncbi:MAG TPA: hypothetical protein VNY73_06420, partial [Bacteroidia bacterium]|nr:hypothetical protein [Bacteroidia bacterium]
MKTTKQKIRIMVLGLLLNGTSFLLHAQNQAKPVAAVLGIDSKGVIQDAESVGYMVRLEMEKANVYNMMDKYDVADVVKKSSIDVKNCFGKSCVVAAGKALGADKMITGSIERFGEKIVIFLKVIDVKTETVEKQDATEYLNLQPELQKMIEISVKKVLGISLDPNMVNLLINYDVPIESPKTQIKLNGPRMGASMTFGDAAKVLAAKEGNGGFNMYPAMFQFGWQHEWQYLSAGNFQALVEGVGLIGGLESGRVIPSLTILNGFRFGKAGWEFGFGPSFRVIQKANGFYGDGNNNTVAGQWYLNSDWGKLNPTVNTNPYASTSRLDSRGFETLS